MNDQYIQVSDGDTSPFGEYAREHNARVNAPPKPIRSMSASVTAEELDEVMQRSNAQRNAERAAVKSGEHLNKLSIRPSSMSIVTGPNGSTVTKHGSMTVYAEDPNPRLVTVNGIEMLREDAIRQGWTPPPGPLAAQQEQPEQQQKQEKPEVLPEHEAPSSTMADADLIMQSVDKAFGAETTNRAIALAAETGDWDQAAQSIPGGVPSDIVEKIVTGYTDAAERMLAPTGASVELLNLFLSHKEMAEARRHTVSRNGEALRELGRTAQDRLSTLPHRDPEKFKAFVAEYFPGLKISHRNGEAVVRIGQGETTWGAAVRSGSIKW